MQYLKEYNHIKREGERRRAERPHQYEDLTVKYKPDFLTGKASIIIDIPDHDELIINQISPSAAKEAFDNIQRHKRRVRRTKQ